MELVTQAGSLTEGTIGILNRNFGQTGAGGGFLVRDAYFVDKTNGSDVNSGEDRAAALRTAELAYEKCVAGRNDAVVLVGDGSTTNTWRLSSGFTWAKNATHLIGDASAVRYSNRARIAPTSGATAFAAFFTVSGSGCQFSNVQLFQGFDTGVAAEICLTVSGSRNAFLNCHVAGMGDAEGAADAGSRMLKITGGENYFGHSTIGLDTTDRDAANANIEFAGGTARNVFEDCLVPVWASDTDPLGIIVSAAAAADRTQHFRRCAFVNTGVGSGGSACAALATLAASIGGVILLEDCIRHGFTEWGTDATSRGQIYIGAGGVTANGHTGGETVVASTS